ncbi:FAD-dependent oxidoreductase [Veillonella parvula]|nr:FAD-dependent oxidoreductase [Veillonella parvula]MCQ4978234.1 FAD-dependent oxidoreductase [Veillonella parvula]
MTGVEGYLESAASGLMVGLQVARYLEEQPFIEFPKTTLLLQWMLWLYRR